jgi:nitrilase
MNPKVAVIQMNSGADLGANLRAAGALLEQAATQGASLAVLPENFAFMGARDTDKLAHAEIERSGPIQQFLADISKRLSLWIVAGTIPLASPNDTGKVFAASLVYDAWGVCVTRYDKIHLFDVEVQREDKVESYRESATIERGAGHLITVKAGAGTLGLSVCYDLRFPELYRGLAAQGAELLCVPSAFTEKTGEAHWLTLLRARAIENQCFVLAPNQSGTHPGGRRTWGHSMILDPWGEVLAQQDSGEGIVVAELDRARFAHIRQSFPSLAHRRL